MQYEYIGHVPNDNGYVKGKRYFINPKREENHVVCNIMGVDNELNRLITKEISTVVYHSVEEFRHNWNVVSAVLAQERTEPAELKA
jgi:hypothetical protein